MNRIHTCLISLLLVAPLMTTAQTFRFSIDASVPVSGAGGPLTNPWTGGLNAPQFSKMDVDLNGTEDMVVFDRSTNKISVFLASGNSTAPSYRHAPWLESLFPPLQYWMLLVDYDGDGRKDIFTWTDGGIKIYRQQIINSRPSWEVASDLLMTLGFTGPVNLYVSTADIPAITDLDNDGDLDILVAAPTGHIIEYHQNLSVEKYGHTRILEYKRAILM